MTNIDVLNVVNFLPTQATASMLCTLWMEQETKRVLYLVSVLMGRE